MHDPLQTLGEPHGTQEIEGPQAVAGVGEVQQRSRLDQEADGWVWTSQHGHFKKRDIKTWQPTRGNETDWEFTEWTPSLIILNSRSDYVLCVCTLIIDDINDCCTM